ncbi:hypothetical protein DCC62_29640 [candidate division KSB1 bacterium]|nr:MAG: hypothetical protein DCC62_29640 [candidate division KSB1 bacterium]
MCPKVGLDYSTTKSLKWSEEKKPPLSLFALVLVFIELEPTRRTGVLNVPKIYVNFLLAAIFVEAVRRLAIIGSFESCAGIWTGENAPHFRIFSCSILKQMFGEYTEL